MNELESLYYQNEMYNKFNNLIWKIYEDNYLQKIINKTYNIETIFHFLLKDLYSDFF